MGDEHAVPKLLTIPEVAERLSLHEKSVALLIRRGQLGSIRIGLDERPNARKQVRVAEDQLQTYIKAHRDDVA